MVFVYPPPPTVPLFEEDMAEFLVCRCCRLLSDDEWFYLKELAAATLRGPAAAECVPLLEFVLSASEFLRLFAVVCEMGIFVAVGMGPNPVAAALVCLLVLGI